MPAATANAAGFSWLRAGGSRPASQQTAWRRTCVPSSGLGGPARGSPGRLGCLRPPSTGCSPGSPRLRAITRIGCSRLPAPTGLAGKPACQGWSQVDIARLAGLNANTLSRVVRDSPRQVAAATADAVARVYLQLARLCRTDQTGRWVQARARRRGYLPPAAWTPWTIDDPRARPLPVEGWERG